MRKLDQIDDLFRSGLEDYEPIPPVDVWDRIEKDLTAKSNSRRALPIFLKIAAGISLLIGLSWAGLKLFISDDRSDIIITQTPAINIVEPEIALQPQAKFEKPSSQDHEVPGSTDVSHKNNISVEPNTEDLITGMAPSGIVPAEKETGSIVSDFIPPVDYRYEILNLSPGAGNLPSADLQQPSKNDMIIQQNLLAMADEDEKKTDWIIGGKLGPQYTYRNFDLLQAESSRIPEYMEKESGLLAYTGGVNVEADRGGRLTVQSGLFYSKIAMTRPYVSNESDYFDIGETYNSNSTDQLNKSNTIGTIVFENDLPQNLVRTDEGYVEPGPYELETQLGYVEIPFVVKYKIIDRKLGVNINGGIWADILMGTKVYKMDGNQIYVEGINEDMRTLTVSSSLSFGFTYPISNKLSLNCEPFFRYYLSQVNTNIETAVYPYSLGILTGVNYYF